MSEINIHTVLGFCPRPKKHEMLVITRGASASIDYNLFVKVFKMDDIDQFTYIFKQGKNLIKYSMVNYFVPSLDAEVVVGKDYYTVEREDEETKLNVPASLKCKATKVINPTGSPIEQGYYESYDLKSGEEAYWDFDPHFSYIYGSDYSMITLRLNPLDTLKFKPTSKGCEMECEVAIRLNTDIAKDTAGLDSIIIEPQHQIAVVDSLFAEAISRGN